VASRLKGGKTATAADETSNALEAFVTELFGTAHAHGIHVPSSATLLIKTLVTIEGVARSLHPELNLGTAAAPVILRSLAPRWMKWAFQSRS
jgi:predicted unusual protein kinase regulating ubiquinone biosynthesis (AarF/ABC1/UbiB family)